MEINKSINFLILCYYNSSVTVIFTMKRIFLVIVFMFCAGLASAQLNVWRWQNPLPVGNYLRAVQMISLNTIYVCGDNGNFMRSTDGGASWDVQNNVLKIDTKLNSLSFLDQNYGMICGDGGRMIKTTDGGKSWQNIVTNAKYNFNGILVLDKNIAIVISNIGSVFRTNDGGKNWISVPLEESRELFSIKKHSTDFLTITGYAGTLRRSTDMGLTWPAIETKIGNSFYSANFSDSLTGTIVGENAAMRHTSDGGVTWSDQQLADKSIITANLNVIDGKDPNIMAIVGNHGTLLYTTDGGTRWQESFLGTAEPISGLSFFDKATATAVGRNGLVLHTDDGGVTWTFMPHKAYTEILQAVAFPRGDTSLGLAVGNAGTILRTTDGGKIWALIESGINRTLYGVSFMGAVEAIAVGEYGTILKSTDAGMTWAQQNSTTRNNLYGVNFASSNTGIAVGDSGTILTTSSAGLFWTRRHTTPITFSEYFKSVSFPDPFTAYICGELTVYKTTDAGISWYPAIGASESRGQSISFGDSLHGGFVYSDKYGAGYTRCTSNGGITFDSTYPSSDHTPNLFGICFSDRQHATIVGAFGYIAHSTDGGKSWFEQDGNTVNTLNAVSFGTLKAGTAVGFRGNIMRITSDEKLSVHELVPKGVPKIILDHNYPNPFSGSTTISYNLPASGFTKVEVFSADGNTAAILANEFQISGDHTIRFEAGRLASGAYIIRITSGVMSAFGEMILSR